MEGVSVLVLGDVVPPSWLPELAVEVKPSWKLGLPDIIGIPRE